MVSWGAITKAVQGNLVVVTRISSELSFIVRGVIRRVVIIRGEHCVSQRTIVNSLVSILLK